VARPALVNWVIAAIIIGTLTVTGCVTSLGPVDDAPPPASRPTAASQPVPAAETPAALSPASAPAPVAGIRRSELQRYVRQGAQSFIQLVRVRATFRHGRFFGWRIQSYAGPGPVQPGDVVTRVNMKPLERPDQFMKVWEQMGNESELVVELWRQGQPLTLRYPIVDE